MSSPNPAASPSAHKIQLLVVEDSRADFWLVEEAISLHQVPVDVHLIQDGEQAIAYIQNAEASLDSPCPGLILLDLNLPKKSGADVLRAIRSGVRCRTVPVVIMTSSDSPKDRAEVNRLGADAYFRKPIDYNSFLNLGNTLNQFVKATSV